MMHNFKNIKFLNNLKNKNKDTAIIKVDHVISNAQSYPLIKSLNSVAEFYSLIDFKNYFSTQKPKYKAIFIQLMWDFNKDDYLHVVKLVRESSPLTKIIFLDFYAPLHIPNPWILDTVDLYIKKQVLSDINQYTSLYDTNLVEYESAWDSNFIDPSKLITIDIEKLNDKLFVGWNFATDPIRIKQFFKSERQLKSANKTIDIHCRMTAPSDRKTWYTSMRGRAFDAIEKLSQNYEDELNILNENKLIKYNDYIRELINSKLCISPFGYGEVCWRDFEAILAGSLLIKPDMSHLVTKPNIYIPYETYVPINWDYSDLEEKCIYYIENQKERYKITSNARAVWDDFIQEKWIILLEDLSEKLGLDNIFKSKSPFSKR